MHNVILIRVGVTRGGNRHAKNYPGKFPNDLFLNFLQKDLIILAKFSMTFLVFHAKRYIWPQKFQNIVEITYPTK